MDDDSMVTETPGTSTAIYWLALSLTPGLGPTRGRKLVQHFGNPQDVFHASLTELEGLGLQAQSAQSIALGKSLELAHEGYAKAAGAKVEILTKDDAAWPARLSEIYDPPLVLYVRGNSGSLSCPGIAIVGTRHPTPYGIGMAERLACDLAMRGLVIFSGMARGVDAYAHRGALKGPGVTVAVFGTGVDVIYPKENRKVAESILAGGGALVSEFPLEAFPAPQNFPIRNRIISGLSLGVLVVEAAEYSGTRITARCALEQGRELFAVPGNVISKNSWGPNTLIKQGAKLTATWEDVWEELPAAIKEQLESQKPVAASDKSPQTGNLLAEERLSPGEKAVLALLKGHEATHIDEIIEKLEPQISSSEVFTVLFELELNGKIKQMPGKNFVKSF
ncbi:MAG TPA: DNA-processing protein DprA [Candidatus Angelobacter sp.]|jgi:DNA processing protein|nr:DNA-processing protein DprA [Candidatus Angelobacter sp.]